jgi:hypothetical protein
MNIITNAEQRNRVIKSHPDMTGYAPLLDFGQPMIKMTLERFPDDVRHVNINGTWFSSMNGYDDETKARQSRMLEGEWSNRA